MANKKTAVLTEQQYKEILSAMESGSSFFRPNEQIRLICILEANLGSRIGDILALKRSDFKFNGSFHFIYVKEHKTGKLRDFAVNEDIYNLVEEYCKKNGREQDDYIFTIKARAVQTYINKVCDWLEIDNIGTHSFRKLYGTNIYNSTGGDIRLTQKALNHSSPSITQVYIGVDDDEINHVILDRALL